MKARARESRLEDARAGVVVNDALVLVDFINRAIREGKPLLEAVAQAGAQRLRPVILTTMTTVVALLPMAFGLLFTMIGTLFVIPLSYASVATAEKRVKRMWVRMMSTRAGEAAVG